MDIQPASREKKLEKKQTVQPASRACNSHLGFLTEMKFLFEKAQKVTSVFVTVA